MKKLIIALSVIVMATAFVSCQKETEESTPANINGTWTFVSMDVTTITSHEYNDGSGIQKAVTTSKYTTENNTGTITIDPSSMTSNNLSYSVNTISQSDIYFNGVLENSSEVPFNFSMPASNGTCNYRTVSADSIYFENGSVFMNDVSAQSIPAGAKLSMEGNVLYITTIMMQSTTQVISGINMKTDVNATAKAKLQRQ